MEAFIKHYFELKDFLTRVNPTDDEINNEIIKLKVDSIINAEFLKHFYTKQMRLHEFKEDLLKLIFKHAENIDYADELKEFIRIVKEKYDEECS